ncbi:5218_t:CDS:2, partial [Diversispora eburnea]
MTSHNFHVYFTLIKNSNNSTNVLAVCNFCIRKYGGLETTQVKPECYTSNQVQTILKLLIPDDKKKRKELNKNDDENKETVAIFEFISPGIQLPKCKAITGKILQKSSQIFQENIIKLVKQDQDGVTVTFDGWSNIKQEHIWGVVFITTSGQPLIWDFLSAKFNDNRSNVTRNNGISNIPADRKTVDQNNNRKLPDDIADIINDQEFWITLSELQNLLYSLCRFLNKLQKDTACLHE